MNDPSPSFHGTPSHAASTRTSEVQSAHSVRSRRTATWARPRNSDDGYSRYIPISMKDPVLLLLAAFRGRRVIMWLDGLSFCLMDVMMITDLSIFLKKIFMVASFISLLVLYWQLVVHFLDFVALVRTIPPFILSCSDSILRHASSDFKKMGQRIFVFIVGGATRSEVTCWLQNVSEVLCTSMFLFNPTRFWYEYSFFSCGFVTS